MTEFTRGKFTAQFVPDRTEWSAEDYYAGSGKASPAVVCSTSNNTSAANDQEELEPWQLLLDNGGGEDEGYYTYAIKFDTEKDARKFLYKLQDMFDKENKSEAEICEWLMAKKYDERGFAGGGANGTFFEMTYYIKAADLDK